MSKKIHLDLKNHEIFQIYLPSIIMSQQGKHAILTNVFIFSQTTGKNTCVTISDENQKPNDMKTNFILFKHSWLMRATFFAFIFIFYAATNLLQAQKVTTDKTDYAPLDFVTISCSGWQSGETVSFLIEHLVFISHPNQEFSTTADGSGNIQNSSYQIASSDIGETFRLTARGQSSGLHAETTFTDAINNPVPAISSISPTSKCAGDVAFTLTVNGSNFNSTSVVYWNGTSRTTAFVSSTQLTASITGTNITTAGSFPVTVVNQTPGGGTSNAVNFTVNSLPNVALIYPTGTTNVCVGSTLQLSNATSGGVWSSSNNGTATVSTSGLVSGIVAGDVTIYYTVTDGNTCSKAATKTVHVIALPTGTLSNNGPVCSGENALLTFTKSTGTGPFDLVINGTTYAGIASGGTISVNPSAPSTTYTLTSITDKGVTPSCPNTVNVSTTVTVNALPTMGSVSVTDADACFGSPVTFSADGLINGTTDFVYSLTIDGENTVQANANGIVVTDGTASFTVPEPDPGVYNVEIVSATVNGCSSHFTGKSATFTVKPNPTLTGVSVPAPEVCFGSTVAVTASGLFNGSTLFEYTVAIDHGTPNRASVNKYVSGGITTITFTTPNVGTYDVVFVSATINGCKTDFSANNVVSFTVVPDPTISITGGTAICTGSSASLSATTGNGTGTKTIQWQSYNGTDWIDIAGQNETTLTVSPTATTNYRATYSASGNECTTAISNTQIITVNELPTCSISGASGPLCPSSTGNTYTAPAGMNTYAWSVSGNGTIAGAIDEQTVSVSTGKGCGETFTLSLTITDGNGCSSSCQKTVNVNDTEKPVLATVATSHDLGCNPTITTPAFTGTDNCQGNISASIVVTTDGPTHAGCAYSQTWNANYTDGCLNAADQVSITYTWTQDILAPTVLTAQGDDANIGCNPTPTAIEAVFVAPVFEDNCSTSSVEVANVHSGTGCIQSDTRTWTASDACSGLTKSVSQVISYTIDTEAPVIDCTSSINLTAPNGSCAYSSYTPTTPTATDNCTSSASLVVSGVRDDALALSDPYPIGSTKITWSTTDACGNPGTCSTMVNVSTTAVHNVTQDTWYCNIQSAIAAANSNDEIDVSAGTYTEAGQIIINKNLTIVGADKSTTIIKPDQDTGGSGDARGWFLVNSGIQFNLKNITLDGNGKNIMQGVRNNGSGTIDHVAFTGIKYPGYMGTAVVAFGNVTVQNSSFTEIGRIGIIFFGTGCTNGLASGNTYTGKGIGDWLDYGVEIGGGAVAAITNCNISNNKGIAASDGSTSAAIIATTYYGAGTTAAISGCTLTNNTTGIDVGYDGSDESSVTATHNKIYRNTSFGISSTNPKVIAENNWWGDASGPNNIPNNTCGLGNAVSVNVDFNPWWTTDSGSDGSGVLAIHNETKDTWYCKVQDAIDDPVTVNGDVISIPAGSYTGNITVSKGVKLHGANYGVSCSGSRGLESLLIGTSGAALTITADNVTIDGFEITNPNGNNAISVSGKSGTVISHNVVHQVGNSVLSGDTHAVAVSTTTAAIIGATISDNCFSDIHGGENNPATSNGSASAIGVGWSSSNYDISELVIERNSIRSVTASTVAWASQNKGGKGAYGIIINVGASGTGKATGAIIRNNTISNLEGLWAHAVGLEGDTPDATVVNNLISNLTDHKTPSDAVGVQVEDNDGAASVAINNNSFTSVGLGIQNVSTGLVGANCNWYGVTSVAGVTAMNSGSIAFDPWLSSGTNTTSNTGFIPEPNSCNAMTDIYVNDASASGDGYTTATGNDATGTGTKSAPYATISKAVSMAMVGSKIYVDAGTYQEQIQVGKSLDIIGLDRATTILKAPATLALVANDNTSSNRPIIYAFGTGNEINIQKITVDGDGGRSGDKFYGVYYYQANGTFTNSRITAIRNNPFSGVQSVAAFVANHQYDASIDQTVTVSNNIIDDYQKCGIIINELNTQGIVTGNTVTGQNIPEVTAQNGIQFGYGAFGTITGNTVTHNIWNKVEHPHTWTAAGILLAGAGVDATNRATGKTTTVGGNILNGNENALSSGKGGFGYDSNLGLVINANTFNNNKIQVSLDDAGTTVPNVSDVYDKFVKNPAQTNWIYGSIQYAIDQAASGNILNVSTGTFIENVTIFTPLTVIGADKTSTVVLPALSAPNPAGGGSLPPGSSNVFLIQANDVTIQNLTVDGNNPALTSGILVGGADLDARNGIITNHNAGVFNNLEVGNVEVKNIYLRGVYASSGGTFNFHDNTIENVQADPSSIALFNFGGSGSFTNNTVSDTNDAIASNWSKGTTYSGNTITNSGSGIHTDNNGGSGGTADLIQNNSVSNGKTNAYGIWIFAPYVAPTIQNNTITNVSVGLANAGQFADVSPTFTGNTINCNNLANSACVYQTTDLFGYGTSNVSGTYTNNFFSNGADGFYLESETGNTNTITVNSNSITGNTAGVELGAGDKGAGTFTSDFTCNWWGFKDAASVTSAVVAAVNFTPWTVNGADNSVDPGFQPMPESCGGVPVAANVTVSDVKCFGGNDGTATANVTAGLAPYTYSWNTTPVQTSETATGLIEGTYTVTVTDFNGSTVVVSGTVSQPDAPLAVSADQTNVLCFGNLTGTINLNVSGGTGTYSYAWAGSGVKPTDKNQTGLASGTYSVVVTDQNSCSTSPLSVTITQPDNALSVVLDDQTSELCSGATSGVINVTASGGTSPYRFEWEKNGSVYATTEDLSNLSAGTYDLTVTDKNGCIANLTAVKIEELPTPTLTALSATGPTCYGENITFTATGLLPGVLNTFKYKVTVGSSVITGSQDATSNSSGEAIFAGTGYEPGSYTFEITAIEVNGCTSDFSGKTASFTIKPNPTLGSISIDPSVVCVGSGAATLTVSGLLNGVNVINSELTVNGTTYPFEESNTISGGTISIPYNLWNSGAYSLKINSITIDGCTTNFTTNNSVSWTVVADPAAPTAIQSPNKASVCVGTSLTLTDATLGSGGTGGCNIEYATSTDGGANWSDYSTTVPILTATGTDNRIKIRTHCLGSGCDLSGETVYSWLVNPYPVITNPGAQTACDNYTLPIILGSNLVAAKYYNNSQALGGTEITGPITSTQTIWIYDATVDGCSDEESFAVTIDHSPVADAPAAVTSCGPYTLPALTNGNYFTTTGGVGPLSAGDLISNSTTLYVFAAGTASCPNAEHSFTITVNPIPTPPTVDVVDNHDGTSTLTASDFSGTLLWSTNETTSSITVNTGGVYTVTQTVNGCTSTAGSRIVVQTPNTTIQTPAQVSCGEYKVDVTVQDITNVGAISLKLNFDPLVIAYQSADINSNISNPIYDGNNTTGQFSFSYSGSEINLPKDAVLFSLYFSVRSTASETTTPLTWSRVSADCEYSGPDGIPVYFSTFEDKNITVNTCTISGTLKYNNPAQTPMNLVELTLSPGNTKVTTDVDGKYSFTGLHDGVYSIAVTDNKKEVGYINSTDAALANAWGTSEGTIEYVKFLSGDVAQNNLYINNIDALRIQKFFVNGLAFDKDPWVYWKKGVTIKNNFMDPKPANFDVALSGANVEGYDLYGMCTGDFNGSFTPTKLKSTSSSLMLTSAGNMLVSANQEFELPMRAGTSMEVGAVSMILRIPSGLVNVQDVVVNGSAVAAEWAVNGDELRIGWYSSMPVNVAANENLITLKLITTETFAPNQSIDLALKFDPLNELADGTFNVVDGAILEVAKVGNLTVGVDEPTKNQELSISNYPNPFRNSTTVAYSLPVDGKVSIVVYNELGQSVMTLINGTQNAGKYTILMNSSMLRPGIYLAKLRLANRNVNLVGTVKLSVHE